MKTIAFQEFYELKSFIEYVGRLQTKESNRTRGHYIGYRNIRETWIRNDDERCHTTIVEGSNKVNMMFYRRMNSNVLSDFDIEEEGILHWKKSVVIRGVFKPTTSGRGRGRGASKASAASTQQDDELTLDDLYMMEDTSSSNDDKVSGSYCLLNMFP